MHFFENRQPPEKKSTKKLGRQVGSPLKSSLRSGFRVAPSLRGSLAVAHALELFSWSGKTEHFGIDVKSVKIALRRCLRDFAETRFAVEVFCGWAAAVFSL